MGFIYSNVQKLCMFMGLSLALLLAFFSDSACSLMMSMVISFEIIITKKCVNLWLKFIQMAVNLKVIQQK